ncbi:tetratricopeptide repeat protein [Streptomyces sp. NPDC006997]|uniref:tetratricopeptide repeat protein n=1 Tax=Streptomyces sp. NPDC006997 TaxID=3155356 RepID=UPI0033D0DD1C
MSVPSRDQQREPIEVRVTGADGGHATVGGVPVVAGEGEEPQQAVLRHLRRMARASQSPVLATVHDERIGYVVPLQVDPDGSSRFTGEPVETPRESGAAAPTSVPAPSGGTPVPSASPVRPVPSLPSAPLGQFGPPPVMAARPGSAEGVVPETGPYATVGHRQTPPEQPAAPAPARPTPAQPAPARHAPAEPAPTGLAPTGHTPAAASDTKPTPPRGFDAVAEAILGDDDDQSATGVTGASAAMTRIGDAVKSGRIEAAAELAERALGEASGTRGPEHAEVLRLRELAAYVAYLAGDPVRSFRLSLDLAGVHHRTHDAEAAYGNVQSAATAWRAVRDPELGLALGRELIALWTRLAAAGGVAAEDAEELETAHARMARLTQRARRAQGAHAPS